MSKGVEEKIKEIHDYLQNQSKKSKPINLLEDNDGYEDGMLIPVYSPKKKKAVKFPLQSPDLSKFQLRSERNIANGYLGLGANKKINEVFIPELPISKITNLQSSLNGLQLKSEKNVANGYLGLDSNVKIGLGFIPELPISKITNLQSSLNRDILSIAITGDRNKILTLTKIDGTTLTAPFTDLGDTADVFLNGLNFNTANGTFTAVLNDSKTSSVNIDGRYSLLNHHHDDRYLKFQAGSVSEEVKFEAPVFFEDTIQARNPILILESMAQMDSGPGNKVVRKDWILSKIPTKTSQLNNDSGFAYVGNIPNIHVVTLGGVLNSAALNVHYPSSKNPIKTILVNKNPGSEAMYIRISSSEWLKINATKI